jgi:predicted nuclease with RNAse H fold
VSSPALKCSDDDLDKLIAKADVVGIDAPFGWPRAFAEAVADWTGTTWGRDERIRLQYRATDLLVQEETGIWPLSVSTDRIALPAMRAMALLQRHKVKDRSGDGKFFEVYPAASLKRWQLPCRKYKQIDEPCSIARVDILKKLRRKLPWLEVPDEYANTSDALDSLIASLTAWAAAQGLTLLPKRTQASVARREGWIHLPTALPQLK